jgi:pentatricopeptide repeat protein
LIDGPAKMFGSEACPTVPLIVPAVHKLESSGDFESPRRLIDKMPKFGCLPNVVVYTALLDGVCSFGDVDAAPRLVEKMEDTNWVLAAHPTW